MAHNSAGGLSATFTTASASTRIFNETVVFSKTNSNVPNETANLVEPSTFALVTACLKTIVDVEKADEAARKIKDKKHRQEMEALRKEKAFYEKKEAELQASIASLTKELEKIPEDFKRGNESLIKERREIKNNTLTLINEVEDLEAKVRASYEDIGVGRGVVTNLLQIDVATLCCPEGKKTVPEGDTPAECNIFKCPSARIARGKNTETQRKS